MNVPISAHSLFAGAFGNSVVDGVATREAHSGLHLDADIEAGIAGTRARNETELLGMAAPTLDNNPQMINSSCALTQDQRVAHESSARRLAGVVYSIPRPPVDLQTLEEVAVVGSRGGTSALMRQIDQCFTSSAWDSWRQSWGSNLRDLKYAVNGPAPLIDPRSVIDANKGALSHVADNLMMAVSGSSHFQFGQEVEQRLRDRYYRLGDRIDRAANQSLDKIKRFAKTLRGGDLPRLFQVEFWQFCCTQVAGMRDSQACWCGLGPPASGGDDTTQHSTGERGG